MVESPRGTRCSLRSRWCARRILRSRRERPFCRHPWDPKGDGKMAVRGGYGVFFEHTNGNEGNTESLEGSPPYSLNASQFNVNGYSNIGGGGLLFPLGVKSIPNKAIWPYVQQFHLDVQKELPSHFVATVSYVGSKGTHLTQPRNLNQLHPIASGNPFAACP